MAAEQKVRICIVGCGKLVTRFGLPGMARAEGVVVAGLCDNDPGRLAATARRSGVSRLYRDYEEVLREPGIDAVYVAAPPPFHYDMTRRAIEAGKHVLCEKPFTLEPDQALDLERRVPPGLVVMPAHNYMYAPGIEHARDMVNDGLIGMVTRIENVHKVNIGLWNAYSRYYYSEESGGVLGDDFCHLVYTTMLFGGKISAVSRVAAERGAHGVFDKVSVAGTTERGAAFELLATWRSIAVRWNIRIVGEQGEVRVNFFTGWKAEAFDLQGRLVERRGRGNPLTLFADAYRVYQREYEDFARAIVTGRPPRVVVADGVATARMIAIVRTWDRQSAAQPLVLVRDAAYERLDECMGEIIDRLAPELDGKRVLLKPNILGAWPVERAATTHPAVVEAVARAVEQRGGVVRVGDNPGNGSYGKGNSCADAAGILRAAGTHWVDIGRESVSASVDSRFFSSLAISREVLDADVVINLPKLKTHPLTVLTGAVKNMFGILVGRQKAIVHSLCPVPKDFCEALVDIYRIRPPHLTIMDAVVAMEGNGPTGGQPRAIGKIIASRDGIAVDAVAAALVGIAPASLDTLKAAAARHLGQTELARMRIEGSLSPVARFRLPFRPARSRFVGGIVNRLMPRVEALPRFHLLTDICTRCGECRERCPRGAIRLEPYPRIDRSRCIGCYCCFELCPNDALALQRVRGVLSRPA